MPPLTPYPGSGTASVLPQKGQRYAYNNSKTGIPEFFTIEQVDPIQRMIAYKYDVTGTVRAKSFADFAAKVASGIFTLSPSSIMPLPPGMGVSASPLAPVAPSTPPVVPPSATRAESLKLIRGGKYLALKSEPLIGLAKGMRLTYEGPDFMGHIFRMDDGTEVGIGAYEVDDWVEPDIPNTVIPPPPRHQCEESDFVNISAWSYGPNVKFACKICGTDKPDRSRRIEPGNLKPDEVLRVIATGTLATVKSVRGGYVEIRHRGTGKRERLPYGEVNDTLEFPEAPK